MNDDDKSEQKNRGTGLGSLLQLVARGPNDDFLMDDTDSHLFQQDYKKHTPFVINNDEFTLGVDFDTSYSVNVPLKDHFIQNIFIKFSLPDLTYDKCNFLRWQHNLSQRLFKSLSIKLQNTDIFHIDNIYSYIQHEYAGVKTLEEKKFIIL